LRGVERPFGLGVERRGRVVVRQRHRLAAGANDVLLGKRRIEVADGGAGFVDPAIEPGAENRRAGIDVIVIRLEALDQLEFLRRETPHLAGPGGDGLRFVDFDNLPVVGAPEPHLSGGKARLADRADRRQVVRIGSQVNLVRRRLPARSPIQGRRRRIDIGGAVGRLRLARVHGQVVEAHLAEPELAQNPVAALDVQTDVLGRDAAEVHSRIGPVGCGRGGLGEFDIAQNHPVRSVLGVLDGHILESEAEDQLELDVVVPYEHLIELVNLVEFVLDVHGFLAGGRQPHVGGLDGMLIIGVQAGTVDGVLWTRCGIGDRVARGDYAGNRIRKRFDCKTPENAFEDGVVGRRVDLIHTPVIGRFVRQAPGGNLRLRNAIGDQGAGGSATDVADVVTEVDLVCGGKIARRPAQHRISRHIGLAVRRPRVDCHHRTAQDFRQTLGHDRLHVLLGNDRVEVAYFVDAAVEKAPRSTSVRSGADQEVSTRIEQNTRVCVAGRQLAVVIELHRGPVKGGDDMMPFVESRRGVDPHPPGVVERLIQDGRLVLIHHNTPVDRPGGATRLMLTPRDHVVPSLCGGDIAPK